jgi:hypothetical protein
MEHKNDYTIIVFFDDTSTKKWKFAHDLNKFSKFLNEKHSSWIYMNVYDRRTTKYLKRFYNGNVIPAFL